MWRFRSFTRHLGAMIYTLLAVLCDAARFLMLCLRPAPALAAENIFLRKQLAQYQERHVKPRRVNDVTRIALVWLSRFFDWRKALVIVQPATLIRWHRQGFRWFWRWRSNPGRPAVPKDLQALIRRMALENPIWGQERITNGLLLKLGLKISPRTQPFREAIPADHTYRILIHDRDAIFSKAVDQSVSRMGLHVIKTPVQTPVANAICERAIGTLRREGLDFVIPLNEKHLCRILKEWGAHYNKSRPHMSLGPGIPQPMSALPVPRQAHRHQIATSQFIVSRPILGGLHHDYRLEKQAA